MNIKQGPKPKNDVLGLHTLNGIIRWTEQNIILFILAL